MPEAYSTNRPLYYDILCPIHYQWYREGLPQCPICLGEAMGKEWKRTVVHLDLTKQAKDYLPKTKLQNPSIFD